MSYIGSTPTSQNFTSGTDYFSGTGSQTAFTLTRTVNSVNDIEVVINNVVQQPSTAYTLSGTTVTFTSAPSSGTNNIYVRYLATNMQSFTVPANSIDSNKLAPLINLPVVGGYTLALPSVTGDILSSNSQLIGKGTTTNNSAAAGYVGEYISSTVAYGSRVTMTNGVTSNITSITLTAGDWDVACQGIFEGTGATSTFQYGMVAATTTGTGDIGAGLDVGSIVPLNNSIWTTSNFNIIAPLVRFSVASNTTVYLRMRSGVSGGGTVAWGQITARRIR